MGNTFIGFYRSNSSPESTTSLNTVPQITAKNKPSVIKTVMASLPGSVVISVTCFLISQTISKKKSIN